MLLNCGLWEDSWESLGLQGDPTSPSWRKSVQNIHWKDWCWNSNSLATWCEELTHWKRPWCWERLKAEREGADRGWDCWMASLTQCIWVWVNSRSWWWTGSPACCSPQRRKESDMTKWLNWTELKLTLSCAQAGTLEWASQVALVVMNPRANTGDTWDGGLASGLERSLGKGHGNPLQHSCLENPMDREAWWAPVRGVTNSWTQMSVQDYTMKITQLTQFSASSLGPTDEWAPPRVDHWTRTKLKGKKLEFDVKNH